MLSKIDCWHTAVDCADVQAELVLYLPRASTPPANDLLTLSIRPIDRDARTIALPTKAVTLEPPCPVSQMLARPEIAKRICSPTATAMAVGGADAPALWPDAITGCLDPNTKAYGKWPLAIYWASQQQRLGSVEAVFDWAEIETVLRCGAPCRLQYPLCRGRSARCSLDAVGRTPRRALWHRIRTERGLCPCHGSCR